MPNICDAKTAETPRNSAFYSYPQGLVTILK